MKGACTFLQKVIFLLKREMKIIHFKFSQRVFNLSLHMETFSRTFIFIPPQNIFSPSPISYMYSYIFVNGLSTINPSNGICSKSFLHTCNSSNFLIFVKKLTKLEKGIQSITLKLWKVFLFATFKLNLMQNQPPIHWSISSALLCFPCIVKCASTLH